MRVSKSNTQHTQGMNVIHALVLGVLERLQWHVEYQEKAALLDYIDIRGNANAIAASRSGTMARVTNTS